MPSRSRSISGQVADETGGVLPGVTVEATSRALFEGVRTSFSDGSGLYTLEALRPGTYTVTFTLPGFSTFIREGIEITTGFSANVDATMTVGTVEETVTVSGASPVIDVQNVQHQENISRDTLDTLPTGRTYSGYAALTVGAQTAATPSATTRPSTAPTRTCSGAITMQISRRAGSTNSRFAG